MKEAVIATIVVAAVTAVEILIKIHVDTEEGRRCKKRKKQP